MALGRAGRLAGIRMVGDLVLVRRAEDTEKTSAAGVIILPGEAETLHEGTVVAIGQGAYSVRGVFIATMLRVGDRVLFSKHVNLAVKVFGEDYACMHEGQIYAVVEG
ncbi:MAG TPA: co-chaperone GroES [Burkholderiaceae bacterium]|jgi:co-chaperonin GroES (HSP10)